LTLLLLLLLLLLLQAQVARSSFGAYPMPEVVTSGLVNKQLFAPSNSRLLAKKQDGYSSAYFAEPTAHSSGMTLPLFMLDVVLFPKREQR
jgi:hypothetical protein